jgi:hypothetical protein
VLVGKKLWKLKCPAKAKIFMWLLLNNKALIWDKINCKRGALKAQGRCCLCKSEAETNSHLILHCNYTSKVWKEAYRITGLKNEWKGDSIDTALKSWISNPTTSNYKALPLTIAWGVWLARNQMLFEDKEIIPLKCAMQSINILSAIPQHSQRHTLQQGHF